MCESDENVQCLERSFFLREWIWNFLSSFAWIDTHDASTTTYHKPQWPCFSGQLVRILQVCEIQNNVVMTTHTHTRDWSLVWIEQMLMSWPYLETYHANIPLFRQVPNSQECHNPSEFPSLNKELKVQQICFVDMMMLITPSRPPLNLTITSLFRYWLKSKIFSFFVAFEKIKIHFSGM